MVQEKKSAKTIQSVERALDILESFVSAKQELGVTEISKKRSLHKSTVHGILSTLVKRGYIAQAKESGKYSLGIKLFEMGMLVQEGMDLKSAAESVMQSLLEEYGETVHLVVLDQGEVVYIDKKESSQSMRIVSQVGKRLPCHCTGVGKSILAFLPQNELKQIIANNEMIRYTKNTITDKKTLEEELQKIRQQNYAIDNEEILEGLRCIAAPIKDYSKNVVGAVSIAGPSVRLTYDKIKVISKSIVDAASKISYQLGCGQYF